MSAPISPVMIDLQGTRLTPDDVQRLSNPAVGGLILFTRNFEDTDQLKALVASIRAVRHELLIAVDHEGGRVQRFKNGFTHIPSMGKLGSLFEHDAETAKTYAQELGWLMASELIAFDIDISFAPVLDRDHGVSAVIGDRAFSDDLSSITALADCFMNGMHDAGMATTGKHFPGHGAVAADSHTDIPVDERSFEQIDEQDMGVFRDLASRLDAVMPAHVIYPNVCSDPAGFSTEWIQNILRTQLSFDGVVFSDDLSMEGATVAGSFTQRAHAALKAGCDMVLVCNNPDAADEVLENIDLSLLNSKSAERLANMKRRKPIVDLYTLQQDPRWQLANSISNTLISK